MGWIFHFLNARSGLACDSTTCLNGASCRQTINNAIECVCPQNFEGKECQYGEKIFCHNCSKLLKGFGLLKRV